MQGKEENRERQALRRRRRVRQLLGAVVCFLVVVGAASLVRSGVGLMAAVFDDTDEREAYAARINTLVALDPVPFNELSEANVPTLLNAAIWDSIDTENVEYERDESGSMYLPTLDIDRTLAALYGPDFKPTYETFEDHGMTFQYVPEKQAFLLPVTSAISDYSPLVTRIQRESGGVQRVTVGYVSPFGTSGEFDPDATLAPVKYQDYLFRRGDDGNYYLYAIVESETRVDASSSASAPAAAGETADPQSALLDALSEAPVASSSAVASDAAPASDAAA